MESLRIFEFGEFQLDEALQELRSSGEPVALAPRSYELLRYLIEHRDRVVPKAEVLREVWRGVTVSDWAVSAALRDLRQALGDDGGQQRWLQTQRKRGYRFLGSVHVLSAATGAAPAPIATEPDEPRREAGTLPALPRVVVGRQSDLAAVRERLQIPGPALCAVEGWPGVGKTTLAALLARDGELTQRYPDGVLWSTLGSNPDPHSVLKRWARALDWADVAETSSSSDELAERLARFLRYRRVLLILDDLWDERDFAALRIGGEQCGTLVTTRLTRVADEIAHGVERYRLRVLERDGALELLRILVPSAIEQDPESCAQLVTALEGLPLAIHVAAGMLKAEMRHGFSVPDLIETLLHDERRLYSSRLPSDLASDASPTVGALIQRSTDHLDPETRERFAALGVFVEKPAVFDEEAIRSVWATDDPRPTLGELVDRGLLESAGAGVYQMHALLRVHAHALLDLLD